MPELTEQIQEMKTALVSQIGGFKGQLDGLQKQHDDLQRQTDAIDMRDRERIVPFDPGAGDPASEIVKNMIDQKGDFERFRRVRFEVKSTLLSTGLTTPQPSPAIGTFDAFPFGAVRALFRSVATETGSVFGLEEQSNNGWLVASPQTEGETKAEVTADLQGVVLNVSTIAAWIRLSRQALDDVAGLEGYIRGRLLWALARLIDLQLVAGDGLGDNLRGLVPVAVPFDTSLLVAGAGYDRASVLGAAESQVRTAGFRPNFTLLHPTDAYRLRFGRDANGQYVAVPSLPRIVETVAITAGTFLIGDSTAALIRPRHQAIIEM